MRCASQLWRLSREFGRANHFRFLFASTKPRNHLRSNHFYFVTQTFPIRCHKRLELHNIERGKKKRPSRWRRSIYWKSNKFLTQIWRILSLSALMVGKDKESFFHHHYCCHSASWTKIMKLYGLKRARCRIKNNLLENLLSSNFQIEFFGFVVASSSDIIKYGKRVHVDPF